MYTIPVKIERLQKRQRSAGLLHVLAGFFLLVTGSVVETAGSPMNHTIEIGWFPLVVAVVSIIYGVFRKKIDPAAKFNHWIRILQAVGFIVKAIMVFDLVSTITIVSLFIWSGVTLMLIYTETKMLKPSGLGVGNEGITVPGQLTGHLIPWSLLNGFVLRPDYVTITRENNSYTQLEVTAEMDENTIREINDFAGSHIAESRTKELMNDQ